MINDNKTFTVEVYDVTTVGHSTASKKRRPSIMKRMTDIEVQSIDLSNSNDLILNLDSPAIRNY